MALNYERVGWENAPSTATPIDAGNLNHMDNGILAVSKQYDTDIPNLIERVAAIPAMLDSYLAEEIGTDVTNWLNEHVTPGGSTIVVDDTLSVSGAAADSKTVGDALGAKADAAEIPDSPVEDGLYLLNRYNGQNSYIPYVAPHGIPIEPSENGYYQLELSVTNGTPSLYWVRVYYPEPIEEVD